MPQSVCCLELTNFLVSLLWACLQVPRFVSPQFKIVLFSRERVENLVSLANVSVVPGLLDVLTDLRPPPLSWFENLPPTIPKEVWGIYILVLRKAGFIPCIYIGSGTDKTKGITARIAHYDRNQTYQYAAGVRDAVDKGYQITHRAVLAHCPIPDLVSRFIIRILIVCIEGALSCVFWTMRSTTTWYGFNDICLWDKSRFEWNGLCGHSALQESPCTLEELNLTSEQVKEIASNELIRCELCNITLGQNYDLSIHLKSANHILKAGGTDVDVAAAKEYHCDVCNVSFNLKPQLDRHNLSITHQEKAGLMNEDNEVEKPYYCELCSVGFTLKQNLTRHLKKASHLRMLKDLDDEDVSGFHCKICNTTFSTQAGLDGHLRREAHRRKLEAANSFEEKSCDICKISFSSERDFMKHLITIAHIKMQEQAMRVAKEAAFASLDEDKLQEDAEEESDNYCKVCRKTLASRSNLVHHKKTLAHRIKSGELDDEDIPQPARTEHYCVSCQKSFKKRAYLQEHKQSLAHHIKVGTSEEALPNIRAANYCMVCEMGFLSAKQLKNHYVSIGHLSRLEDGTALVAAMKDNHRCMICGIAFSSRDALGSHQKTKSHLENERNAIGPDVTI